MTFYWRPTFSYLQYAQVCARAVRHALKEDARANAVRRDEQGLKFAKWENGKQGELKPIQQNLRAVN
ncbi:ubiquinol-cytochrome c reductase core subunit 1 [Mortierella alpina]|nr:ubiquinol-cytochrome c reductase core subunit 1 [Mortierella alpina]